MTHGADGIGMAPWRERAGNDYRAPIPTVCTARRALCMPTLAAIRQPPNLRAFYDHLLARGKAKMVALVAVMRKLLHAIFGMFKRRTTFDGSKLFALPAPQIPTKEAAA